MKRGKSLLLRDPPYFPSFSLFLSLNVRLGETVLSDSNPSYNRFWLSEVTGLSPFLHFSISPFLHFSHSIASSLLLHLPIRWFDSWRIFSLSLFSVWFYLGIYFWNVVEQFEVDSGPVPLLLLLLLPPPPHLFPFLLFKWSISSLFFLTI